MAIVFVPINGIGLGHVSRSFTLARALRELGEAPVVFSQGCYPEFMAAEIPGLTVGGLYILPPAERSRIANQIAEYARRSAPAVVIEDTHPAAIRFEPDICTLLVVRPTDLGSMRDLRSRETGAYRNFLIADHPESPTWPYDAAGTAEVLSWADWKAMGPVFRSPTAAGRARVRRKYGVQEQQPLYVFSMGGGGSQPGIHDAVPFVGQAAEIATQISRRTPDARFIFIRGPLFPADFKVPAAFETYSVENDMPSLMAEAAGVIGRPSMNMIWECVAAGTPVLPLVGKTYVEPVAERLRGVSRASLLAADLDQWMDSSWRALYREKAAEMASRFPLQQAGEIMRSCFAGPAKNTTTQRAIARPASKPVITKASGQTLVIRIDEVTQADERLMTLLELCAARGLAVSLEVIPYLSRLSETQLPGDFLYEVSQHGYAHLPSSGNGAGGNGVDALRRGAEILEQAFPTKFRHGFSAPFDQLPQALPGAWLAAGGRYITVIDPDPKHWPIPAFRFTARAWDQKIERVLSDVGRDLRKRGRAGLVLHAQRTGLAHVEELLDRILELRCDSKLVSEVALGKAAISSR